MVKRNTYGSLGLAALDKFHGQVRNTAATDRNSFLKA
jgi:hypothetical protein